MKRNASFVFYLAEVFVLLCLCLAGEVYGKVNDQAVVAKLKSVRVPFVENVGQVDKEVAFYAETFGGTVYVTRRGEIVYSLPKYEGEEEKGAMSLRHKGPGKVNP